MTSLSADCSEVQDVLIDTGVDKKMMMIRELKRVVAGGNNDRPTTWGIESKNITVNEYEIDKVL